MEGWQVVVVAVWQTWGHQAPVAGRHQPPRRDRGEDLPVSRHSLLHLVLLMVAGSRASHRVRVGKVSMRGKARQTRPLACSHQVAVGGAEERVAVEVGGARGVGSASAVQVSPSTKCLVPRRLASHPMRCTNKTPGVKLVPHALPVGRRAKH